MGKYKYLALVAITVLFFSWSPQKMQAQIEVQICPPPVCPYGYFDYPPYDCAPYGYYGPEWFPNGIFLGAGPWFHGDRHFWGHVDRHFDEHHRPEHFENFRGNEMRDGHGHARQEHEHGDHDHH